MSLEEQKLVSIVGATGIAGGEIARLIEGHPHCRINHLMAGSSAGSKMGQWHPELASLLYVEIESVDVQLLKYDDVVFLALPHGKSSEMANLLEEVGFTGIIIDIAADHRLESEQDWNQFYSDGGPFEQPYVYGLPELLTRTSETSSLVHQRDLLKEARRIAVPGCNVTAVTLGLQPLVSCEMIELDDIVATLAVGYSGAGKTLKPHLLATNAFENASPYAIGGTHRHIPEMRQNLGKIAGLEPSEFSKIEVSFTPVLVPMNRGIMAVISAKLSSEFTQDAAAPLTGIVRAFCSDEPFIKVLDPDQPLNTSSVSGTNFAYIQVTQDATTGRILVLVAIDNLVRGTAGQAIQSMNLALGLDETSGLHCD
jgi:N-acetyl-gamma-glutamyl-phosphate reductase